MPFVYPEPDELLRRWLQVFGGARCADLVDTLRLDHQEALVEVAATLLDCVIRRILTMSGRYREGCAQLATLPSLADRTSRAAATSTLQAMRLEAPSALSSAVVALGNLGALERATSREATLAAWSGIFTQSGPLYMAVARHRIRCFSPVLA